MLRIAHNSARPLALEALALRLALDALADATEAALDELDEATLDALSALEEATLDALDALADADLDTSLAAELAALRPLLPLFSASLLADEADLEATDARLDADELATEDAL